MKSLLVGSSKMRSMSHRVNLFGPVLQYEAALVRRSLARCADSLRPPGLRRTCGQTYRLVWRSTFSMPRKCVAARYGVRAVDEFLSDEDFMPVRFGSVMLWQSRFPPKGVGSPANGGWTGPKVRSLRTRGGRQGQAVTAIVERPVLGRQAEFTPEARCRSPRGTSRFAFWVHPDPAFPPRLAGTRSVDASVELPRPSTSFVPSQIVYGCGCAQLRTSDWLGWGVPDLKPPM